MLLGVLIFLFTPVLGFGACANSSGLHGSNDILVTTGMVLCFGGPLIGLIMLFIGAVRK